MLRQINLISVQKYVSYFRIGNKENVNVVSRIVIYITWINQKKTLWQRRIHTIFHEWMNQKKCHLESFALARDTVRQSNTMFSLISSIWNIHRRGVFTLGESEHVTGAAGHSGRRAVQRDNNEMKRLFVKVKQAYSLFTKTRVMS